jgi:hypothetical protein
MNPFRVIALRSSVGGTSSRDWYWKKQDTVGPFDVATRFIGIDPHFSAPPLWWEVSIQESFRSCSHRYFATLEQALKRHSELVTSLEAGVLEEV